MRQILRCTCWLLKFVEVIIRISLWKFEHKFSREGNSNDKMSVLYSAALKCSDGELRRNPEMDSSIGYPQQHCNQHNSGLLRYRSAPSSLVAGLVDNNHGCVNEGAFRSDEDHMRYLPSTSSEMETMLSKLISSNNGWSNSESLQEFGGKPVKQEAGDSVPQRPSQQNGYSYGSQLAYQPQQIQGLPNGSSSDANAFDGSFSVVMASENTTQSKMGVTARNCSNLIRQKSLPAGFFSNSSVENESREVGSVRACDISNGQVTASTSGLHGALTFSSRPSSCSRRMPQITENGNESLEENCDQGRNLVNNNGSVKCYMPSFTGDFWDAPAFNSQKTAGDNDEIMFSTSNALESQDPDFGYQNIGLTHHLSLPSSSIKMSSTEKFLQIQGSVPCKIRAKRGFATHPRSIAERVRRTRISERIKKLQSLFPKSDKQASTADMLDLAVEYIKDLQEQVKILTDSRAKCKCTSNQKQYSTPCA